MKKIIFTLDYELYGNGSGDVFQHIIEPTDQILNIVGRYNAKLTIFFEVIEYWKLREEWEKGNRMGYDRNPIEAMELQLKHAYKNGHDVQLHLHPQWVNAYWTEDGWRVNTKEWRLSNYEGTGDNSLIYLLKRGKETIEQIINDKNYHCAVLRAGGYNIQPSGNIAEAMRKTGLKTDSSIYPGGRETGTLSRYDYAGIKKDVGMWYCGNNLEEVLIGKSDLIELPIVAMSILRFQKYLSFGRIKSLLRNHKSAKDTFDAKTEGEGSGVTKKIQFFFQYEAQTWDYCLFSKRMHRKFLKDIERQFNRNVFVLVGHPKSFVSGKGLEYLLKKTQNLYECCTVTQYLNCI